jgi:transcriptional regulator with XRE-family HTH domain
VTEVNDNDAIGQQRPAVLPVDGPTLRAVRENLGVPLRLIARKAGMSHGHLSKVERGEHGRPVTPAIMAAYERVTGVKLIEAAEQVEQRRDRDTGRGGKTWHPGQLTDMRRRAYNAAVGALAVGGYLGEPMSRLIDSTGRPVTPVPPGESDIEQLEQVSGLLTCLDMRYGGGLVSQLAKAVLRWAYSTLDAVNISGAEQRRLHSAVGAMAHRAGWAAFDVYSHEAARSLFRFALYCAVVGEDHDLRGHVLADVAAQHNQLGYHRDALDLIRLAEGDERIAPAVRMVLHGAKARAYGCLAEADGCRRQLEAAQQLFTQASPEDPGWIATLAHPARLHALTGHALADLAQHSPTGQDYREQALEQLTKAVEEFDPSVHTRAYALCVARVAMLRATGADPDQTRKWMDWTRQKLPPGLQVHSGRLGSTTPGGNPVGPQPR